VTKFDILARLILEGLKNPKDNPCWKGYKPVGTKKKRGKTVPNCVPKENKLTEAQYKYKLLSSFNELPETPPYGFWVTNKNQFIAINFMFGHDEALKTLFPDIAKNYNGAQLQYQAILAGFTRMAKTGNKYALTYHPLKTPKSAVKLARDIAAFYNMGVEDDFEGL
jgi:hypothetical protein